MPKLQLTLATLGQLHHGAAELAVNGAIARAIADTEDRGDDGRPRSVDVKLSFVKLSSGLVEVTLEAGVKMPAFKTSATACQTQHVAGQPTLFFQSNSPGNPSQSDLPLGEDDG